MEYKHQEQSLLTHFHNLQNLSMEQMEASRCGKMDVLEDILAQKQMIMDQINNLYEQISLENCCAEIKGQIRKLLLKIIELTEQSQQYTQNCQTTIQRELLSLRHENLLNEKYKEYSDASHLFDESK